MDNSILKKDFVFLDENLKSQDSVFKFIADKAKDLGIVSSSKALVDGFKKRESEGTTGFEDGFAIPHARIKEAKKAAVIVVRLAKGIDWKAMDGNPTNVAIALIVPDGQGDEHMAVLSDVATKLMDSDFKKAMKSAKKPEDVLKAFDAKKAPKAATKAPAKKGSLNVIAITACVTGVAHTYMAEDKLLQEVPKMGYNIRVETHGSKGVGTPFTQKEIDNADLVVFATDINVDNSRFAGKKYYHVKVADAIRNPQGVVKDAIAKGQKISAEKGDFSNDKSKRKAGGDNVLQHILAGISYMIPVIVLGGISLAFSLGLAKAIWGPAADPKGTVIGVDANGNNIFSDPWGPLAVLNIIGGAAFALMIPILAGFIGNSIAGRAAIAPAMVGAFIGNTNLDFMPLPGMAAVQTPTGFVGALISGLLVGYFVRWVNTWNVPKSLRAAMPIFFIPLIAGIGISVIFIYIIGGPIGWVMDQVSSGIKSAYGSGDAGIAIGLLLGALLGAMAGFDMGGPINKIAFVTSSVLITQGISQPMGAMAAAIPVAPIGMGLTTLIFTKFFTKDERGLGIAAIIMGSIGISEGAIPFAIRDPRRAIPANVLGSLVAGAIAGAFQITDAAAHGGPIVGILGAVEYGWMTPVFFLAIIAGVAVTTLVYGFWMLAEAGKAGSVKEAHNVHINDLRMALADKKLDMKQQIKDLKFAAKDDAKLKANLANEIAKIKLAFKVEQDKFKQQVVKAKEAYKVAAKHEAEYIKANKETLNNELKTVREKQTALIVKAKKQEFTKKTRDAHDDAVSAAKDNKVLAIDSVQAKYRTKFKEQYVQSVK